MQPQRDSHAVPHRVQREGPHYGRVLDQLDLDGVDRFTLPVRDLGKAELFYTEVLGGEVVQRGITEIGLREQPAIRVRLAPGAELCLVEQRFGWNPPDTANPHWGFAVPGADIDSWMEHLREWAVPSALVVRGGHRQEDRQTARAELHFLDPDGNQIELVAWDYPLDGRARAAHYNYWDLLYRHDAWPPPEEA